VHAFAIRLFALLGCTGTSHGKLLAQSAAPLVTTSSEKNGMCNISEPNDMVVLDM
jgi:hypothetical protein